MPFIKYYGSKRLGPITEEVNYEDPRHPSVLGRHQAWVASCTTCENDKVPRSEWDARFLERVTASPYEGMNHIGGIGWIEDGRLLPCDRAITSNEYEALKADILSANKAYKERSQASLNAQNNPNMRAISSHELNRLRTRVWIGSYTELTHHVPYRITDSCHAYPRVRQYSPNGMTVHLVDLYHRSERDVGEAIYDGIEKAERFADLLAIAGFGPAVVTEVVGTAPPVCREGVAFDIATLQVRVFHSPVPVPPEDFEEVHVGESDHLPLRHFRDGLAAKLPTTALASFWNALERQADERARAAGAKRLVRCRKCGDEREIGWDIRKSFESMYAESGTEADFDKQRALRGRVQHGDAVSDSIPQSELLPEVGRLQMAAIVSIGKRTGIKPQTGTYMLTGMPVSVFECIREGGMCTANVRSAAIGVVPSILPMRTTRNLDRAFRTGLDLPPQINPLVLPPTE